MITSILNEQTTARAFDAHELDALDPALKGRIIATVHAAYDEGYEDGTEDAGLEA